MSNVKQLMQICEVCKQSFPKNRTFFKRHVLDNGKETYSTICRQCLNKIRNAETWQDGKLHCNCCNEYKDESEFSANASTNKLRNFRRTICKDCYRKRLAFRNKNLNPLNKLRKCMIFRLLGARDRAKNENIYFDLDLEFLLNLWNKQKGLCAISNIPMTYLLQEGRVPTNISIDKIDPHLGYSKDNVQLVCSIVNSMKSDYSINTLLMFCEAIVTNARSWKK